MRKNAWTITIFTCVMGALALFIRWLQTQNFFDEGTMLVKRDSSYGTAVIFIIVFAAIGIALLSFLQRGRLAKLAPRKSLGHANRSFPVAATACALLYLGAAWLLIVGIRDRLGYDLASGALFIASASALAALLTKRSEKIGKNLAAFCAVVPVAALGFLLFAEYKLTSSNPQLWLFAPRILAISFSTLGFCYVAGFFFGQPRPALTVFLTLSAAFFCMMTVADGGGPAKLLIFAALALLQLLFAFSILAGPAKNS